MEQLILIGIILLVSSLLDAAARKKRAGEAGSAPEPEAPDWGVPEARVPRVPGPPVPSYDDDPSFDDAVDAGSRGRTTSEGLIPADVWEEIQALARGGPEPARKAPAPAPAPAPMPKPASARVETRKPRRPAEPMSLEARRTRPPTVPEVDVVVPEHSVHLTHPKYGTPVRDRLTGFDDSHKLRTLSVEATELRRVLRGGGAPLKQAILLQEVLGPPVSLKDDPSAG